MTLKSESTNNGQATMSSRQPLWLPPGASFSVLPKAIQEAIADILNPAFKERVLEASDALARAQGVSYCTTLYLELVMTHAVAEQAVAGHFGQLAGSKSLGALMAVITQKGRVASFLLALQKFHDKLERTSTAPSAAKA
jgi:hypothetical protein